MSKSECCIKEVLRLIKVGDEKAFSSLYDQYWAKVYNFSALYLNQESEIKECIQDVFVRIWDSRHLIDPDKNFDGYIFIITRNIIFKHFDNKLNFTAIDLTMIATLSDNLDAEHILIEKEIKDTIDYIISTLPPRQQEAFNLSRYEQLSYKEIAKIMNISEKTVEHHISKALKKVRDNMSESFVLLPFIYYIQ